MATLLPPPSTTALHTSPSHAAMASRRVPLGNLPNAANSPFREPIAPGTKRPRTNDVSLPPAKKQVIETEDAENRRTVIGRKIANASTTGAAARSTQTKKATAAAKTVQVTEQNLHEIRQWQRHYKKLFPTMVFYYDTVPEETKRKVSKQLQLLGSREEIFFSKNVTHVVTTRSVPNEASSSSSTGRSPPKQARDGTINPSHLDKKAKAASLHPNDILLRAKEMGIKVWGLEKLQRMLTTMFNAETGEAPTTAYRASTTTAKTAQQQGLGQMLQKEKEYAAATMDWATDMAAFRGYYVYVHDMDETTKPTIVRDYSKPATKEQGKWPQLTVTAPGRCPFLDDPSARYERAAATQAPAAEKAPRTRAAAAREKTPVVAERAALGETNGNAQRRQRSVSAQPEEKKGSMSMDPPKTIPVRGTSTDNLPLFGSAQASLRQHPRFAGGEPVASGVQPSNVTSAIRSQMISSTAAAPGGKAGRTKELNTLQRRVLQNSNPYLNNDLRGAINTNTTTNARGQKRKANDSLAGIKEDEEDAEQAQAPAKPVRSQAVAPAPRKKKVVEKEMKPGYCENCRAKFQDFDEHVVSRQHRKFATDDQNWKELDDLLGLLGRPLKGEVEVL